MSASDHVNTWDIPRKPTLRTMRPRSLRCSAGPCLGDTSAVGAITIPNVRSPTSAGKWESSSAGDNCPAAAGALSHAVAQQAARKIGAARCGTYAQSLGMTAIEPGCRSCPTSLTSIEDVAGKSIPSQRDEIDEGAGPA